LTNLTSNPGSFYFHLFSRHSKADPQRLPLIDLQIHIHTYIQMYTTHRKNTP
jgi:hypothetical protein